MPKKVLFFLASLLIQTSLGGAQADPEGILDYLEVVCDTPGYQGSGQNQICFQVKFFSDNTGSNRIQSVNLPLLISGSNIVSVDTSLSSAFSNSVVGHFEILAVTKHGDPDPTVPPFHVSYGAITLSKFPTGNGAAINVCLTVDDTGTICIDTLSSSESDFPILTTGTAIGYVPGWGGTTGQGYPDGVGVCCQVYLCDAIPGDADGNGLLTLADLIRLVNYVMVPSNCQPVRLDCLSGQLCRGDWNGDGEVNLPDLIWGVNYLFDRDRNGTNCLGSSPGNCWVPVPTDLCCLPVP